MTLSVVKIKEINHCCNSNDNERFLVRFADDELPSGFCEEHFSNKKLLARAVSIFDLKLQKYLEVES